MTDNSSEWRGSLGIGLVNESFIFKVARESPKFCFQSMQHQLEVYIENPVNKLCQLSKKGVHLWIETKEPCPSFLQHPRGCAINLQQPTLALSQCLQVPKRTKTKTTSILLQYFSSKIYNPSHMKPMFAVLKYIAFLQKVGVSKIKGVCHRKWACSPKIRGAWEPLSSKSGYAPLISHKPIIIYRYGDLCI